MSKYDLPDMEPSQSEDVTDPRATYTETIDLGTLGFPDSGPTQSLDLSDSLPDAVHKLLHALPIAALLVRNPHSIMFMNDACTKISESYRTCLGKNFLSLFPRAQDAADARTLLHTVFQRRAPRVLERILDVAGAKIWARVNMRSIRFGRDRAVLVLIEDLTIEKKQLILISRHKKLLGLARDQLEKRVDERTTELREANVRLKKEISQRKKIEEELRHAHNELERRVAERTAELSERNTQLRLQISRREKAEERLLLYKRIIESSNDAVFITDSTGSIVEVNESFCRVTGFARGQVMHGQPLDMRSHRSDGESPGEIWSVVHDQGHWKGETVFNNAHGDDYPVLLSIGAISGEKDAVSNYVGIFSDISRIKQTEQKLQELAHFDPLTKLPNRVLFHDRLSRAMLQAERNGVMAVLMLVDLDRFKNVNDTFGHRIGDELLKEVGIRLSHCVRKTDTVARLGGDEFVVVMTGVNDSSGAAIVAEKIIQTVSHPYDLEGLRLFISASIGITVYPTDGADSDRLLQNADTALYHAKRKGRDNYQYFSEDMNTTVRRRLELELGLRAALERNEFVLYYQPILDFNTGKVISYEALIRWRHPSRGLLNPDDFIPLAEDTGLIGPIGEWVLHNACRQIKSWQQNGQPPLPVSVNVSGRQMAQQDVVATVFRALKETDVDPQYLEIELTESFAHADMENAVKFLSQLKERGISISLDDFGTGYSSLSYLRRLPIDKLKIDRSFVRNIAYDSRDAAITEAIVGVAQSLGLKVIAEGVENEQQYQFLLKHGCDAWQGHLFAPPMDPMELQTLTAYVNTYQMQQSVPKFDSRHVDFIGSSEFVFPRHPDIWSGRNTFASMLLGPRYSVPCQIFLNGVKSVRRSAGTMLLTVGSSSSIPVVEKPEEISVSKSQSKHSPVFQWSHKFLQNFRRRVSSLSNKFSNR